MTDASWTTPKASPRDFLHLPGDHKAVSKKECEKHLEYCIKNTNFREATVMNKGDYDVDSDNQGRNDPSIRKTDIAFLDSGCKEDEQVNHLVWHFLQEANKKMFKYNLQYFLMQFFFPPHFLFH